MFFLHYTTHDTRLTHGHRKLRPEEDFEILRLMPDFEILRLTCDFSNIVSDASQTPTKRNFLKTLRLTPARPQPDARFRNQASDATFQNHVSDVVSVTMRQTCSTSPAMYGLLFCMAPLPKSGPAWPQGILKEVL